MYARILVKGYIINNKSSLLESDGKTRFESH